MTRASLRSWALGMTVAAAVAGAARASDLWFHVRIHADGGESQVTVNVPLAMVARAADFVGETRVEKSRVHLDDHPLTKAELRRLWAELEAAPEMTFIRLEEGEDVRVARRGEDLLVEAAEDGDTIEMRLPGPVVEALLSGPGEELEVGAALEALVRHGRGELVTVNGRDEQVRVWIDDRPEAGKAPGGRW